MVKLFALYWNYHQITVALLEDYQGNYRKLQTRKIKRYQRNYKGQIRA